jgi:hypothetical protein
MILKFLSRCRLVPIAAATLVANLSAVVPAVPTIPEAEVQRMTAAMWDFDAAVAGAGSFTAWGWPAGTLVRALDASPNRALADAVFGAAAAFAAERFGPVGMVDFYQALPEGRRAQALAGLPAERKEFVLRVAPAGDGAGELIEAGPVPAGWEEFEYDNSGYIDDALYDVAKVRAALARGQHGAAFDLAGYDIYRNDPQAQAFWREVGVRLVPPDPQDTPDDMSRTDRTRAAAGWADGLYLQAEALREQTGAKQSEIIALLRRSSAGGFRLADRRLAEIRAAGSAP